MVRHGHAAPCRLQTAAPPPDAGRPQAGPAPAPGLFRRDDGDGGTRGDAGSNTGSDGSSDDAPAARTPSTMPQRRLRQLRTLQELLDEGLLSPAEQQRVRRKILQLGSGADDWPRPLPRVARTATPIVPAQAMAGAEAPRPGASKTRARLTWIMRARKCHT
jgi:hypothetical protein